MSNHTPERTPPQSRNVIMNMARRFMQLEASGGILLVIAATIAIIFANTFLYDIYNHILNGIKFKIGFDDVDGTFNLEVKKSLLLWINDGFMAVFFLLVGLEIKREVKDGELSSRSRALLPIMGAIGGILVPAGIYYFINMDSPETIKGWAIPAATDIAFSLGVLSLLGSRVPTSLKILLTAVAVIDDLAAILIIAFFYTSGLVMTPLYFAAGALAVLGFMNWRGYSSITPYILVGIILWVAVLKSGMHATLAGVITAFFIPHSCPKDKDYSPGTHLEHVLHPWVAFMILPIFAFANAGVPFAGMGLHSFGEPVTLGIILGLVVGKPVGIFAMLYIAIKIGMSPKPPGTTWSQLLAVSVLCGIGFTMSLFIGGLAFNDYHLQASIRLGVLVASLISAFVGYFILRASISKTSGPVTPKPDQNPVKFKA